MDLEEAITHLAANSSVYLTSISKGSYTHKCYKFVKSTAHEYLSSNRYDEIIEIIEKQYQPSQLEANTLGSFIFGCFQKYYGDVSQFCSSLCINSLPSFQSESCPYQVWSLEKGKLKQLNSDDFGKYKQSKGYVHVEDNFVILTNDEINTLKNAGLEVIAFIETINGRHRVRRRGINLNNYSYENIDRENTFSSYHENSHFQSAMTEDEDEKDYNKDDYEDKHNKQSSTSNIIIFIIVIIIILLIWSYYRSSDSSSSNLTISS